MSNVKLSHAMLVVALALGAVACARKQALVISPSVPAAQGDVTLSKDSNGNTQLELKIQHLAKPANLTPPAATYVVWVQVAGSAPENRGQLTVNDNLEARFRTVVAGQAFDIFVTAEPGAMVQVPSGTEVLRTKVQA